MQSKQTYVHYYKICIISWASEQQKKMNENVFHMEKSINNWTIKINDKWTKTRKKCGEEQQKKAMRTEYIYTHTHTHQKEKKKIKYQMPKEPREKSNSFHLFCVEITHTHTVDSLQSSKIKNWYKWYSLGSKRWNSHQNNVCFVFSSLSLLKYISSNCVVYLCVKHARTWRKPIRKIMKQTHRERTIWEKKENKIERSNEPTNERKRVENFI